MSRARTVQEAREWFELSGQTVTQWSRDHGFRPEVVYSLLAGRTRGRRGDAHRAAVALGLKPQIQPTAEKGLVLKQRVERSDSRQGPTSGPLTKDQQDEEGT